MEPSPEAIRSISHDLRNLLTAVRGHADLALRGLSPEDPAREDVAHLVVVTAAVFELVDQLDGTDTSDTLIAVNLDSSVAGMRRLLDALLPTDIEMELAPDSGQARVSISKLRIERIVLNLALNARDAMTDRGKLTITTRLLSDSAAQIMVSDTGSGFTEEALAHLFEAGFTTKRESGGSGQGLSALQHFVDGAGGSIDVHSTAGEGATVTVTLPLAESDELASGEADETGGAKAVEKTDQGDQEVETDPAGEDKQVGEADQAGQVEAEQVEETDRAETVEAD